MMGFLLRLAQSVTPMSLCEYLEVIMLPQIPTMINGELLVERYVTAKAIIQLRRWLRSSFSNFLSCGSPAIANVFSVQVWSQIL